MGLPWDTLLSDCDRRLRGSDIRDLLAVTARPEVISFAGGLPAPELFPVDDLRAAFDAALTTDGAGANCMRLNFSHAAPERIEEGVRRLAQVIAARLPREALA